MAKPSAAQQIAELQRSNAIARSLRGVLNDFTQPLPRDIPKVMLESPPFIGARNTELQNCLVRRAFVAKDRRFSGQSITGFGDNL